MIFWKDIDVKVKHKFSQIHKIGGKRYFKFNVDYGDIPVVRLNEITDKLEAVVNTRGRAYAARKRLMYRGKKA